MSMGDMFPTSFNVNYNGCVIREGVSYLKGHEDKHSKDQADSGEDALQGKDFLDEDVDHEEIESRLDGIFSKRGAWTFI